MINVPNGMTAGLPAGSGASSCAVTQAPPPLQGGGALPAAPVFTALPSGVIGLPVAAPAAAIGAAAITPTSAASVPAAPVLPTAPAPAAALPTTAALPAAAALPTAPALPIAPHIPGLEAPQPIVAAPATLPTAAAAAATTTGGAAAAPRPLTTLAPGGNAQDAALVERTLGVLRQSASGAQIVDRMLAVNAKVNVISDEEFAAMNQGDAHAFYDPAIDTMFLRRSDLADERNIGFAAIALAHEGTHLLDDVAGLSEPFLNQVTAQVAAAGGLSTAAGVAAKETGLFELKMIKETRAFLFAGTIARELGLQLPPTDPTSTAIAGGNDQATYTAVWQRLLTSSYNPENRQAAVRNF